MVCTAHGRPKVSTDRAPTYLRVLDELVPPARDVTAQYANSLAQRGAHQRGRSRRAVLARATRIAAICSTRSGSPRGLRESTAL
jgi:hypothetical protein